MIFNFRSLTIGLILLLVVPQWAAANGPAGPGDGYTVHLSAWAEEEVNNDLLSAVLSVERSGPDSARLAAAVAGIMARALGEAERFPAVKVKSAAYATQPVYQRRDGKSERVGWRVSQSLVLESTAVEAATDLIGRLQALDLQMSGLNFTVSDARREALRAELTNTALDTWRLKAEAAVKRLGGKVWRPHEIQIQDEQFRPVQAMLRSDAVMTSEAATPPAVEAGTSRIRVNVAGTAWGR